ncbi:MAG: glycosyltransferase family 4 protein [Bacteroidia bacterium]|nr:glycosyltransferase family 4 protein [Bacteroidia bacterium]
MPARIIISVTSDLVTDQRVQRASAALKEAGYQVMLIGRRLPGSMDMPGKRYRSTRFRLWFNRGPAFYANYNIRLAWYLLWHHADILLSNDLDTLPANYLISRIKRIPLVYDSHEYFTGVPELVSRPKIQAIWKKIERILVPRLRYAYTVNDSIAKLYKEEYGIDFKVIRNVPENRYQAIRDLTTLRRSLGLPSDKKIILLQGAGINVDRGAEEAVMAMRHLHDVLLLIVGGGDVIPELKNRVHRLGISEKVKFEGKKTPADLFLYTSCADLGLTLDKDTNLNYRYSLPNKLFDYIQAGIPILASDLPEIRAIVERYQVGLISPNHQPEELALLMRKMLDDESARKTWKENLARAAQTLNWDAERVKLLTLFKSIGR